MHKESTINRVSIYCASSAKIAPKYFEAAAKITEVLVKNGVEVITGGGSTGLMGQVADTAIALNGKVTGIMPHFMKEVEWFHKGIENFVFVEDMHARKKMFLENVDAVIALPGGCGTLEELLEVITFKRLGKFTEPIIVFNQDGYYTPLLQMLDRCIEEQFLRASHRDIWTVIDTPEQIIDAIKNAPRWSRDAIHTART